MELRDQYLALGKTLKEAEKMAVAKATVNLQAEIVAAKMQLASVDETERQKGVEAINTIQAKAQQLDNFTKKPNEAFNKDYGQKFANTKELRTFVPELKPVAEAPKFDWTKREFINPEEAKTNAVANNIANNKVEANFTINAPQGTTVTGGDKNVKTTLVPQTSSTMSAAR
jgi:phosphopantetheine adenylyltransferase